MFVKLPVYNNMSRTLNAQPIIFSGSKLNLELSINGKL